jgi:RimJ/RimL family protein N-acetyltransferase
VTIAYRRFDRDEGGDLADFLTGDSWPFHAGGAENADAVRRRVASGQYDGDDTQTWWIVDDDERIGLIRFEDLGDDTPLFDLRLRATHRGQGHGSAAVRWLTDHLFTTLPEILRIEAVTRQDNSAMRRALLHNGYAKESHYRDAWPDATGAIRDAVGYAVIRRDWQSGSVTLPDWNDEDPADL